MSRIGKSANLLISIAGQQPAPPGEWRDISVSASFEKNVQASLVIDQVKLPLDAYQIVKDHIQSGLSSGVGIFEGIDMSIQIFNNQSQISAFEGFLDTQDNLIIDDENGNIIGNIKAYDDINFIDEKLQSIDFGYLLEIGVITSADYVNVDYVVIKLDETFEILVMSVMTFILSKQIIESIYQTSDAIATITGIASGSLTGSVGAAIYAAANAIANIAYTAAVLSVVITLGTELIETFVQPVRSHKGILLKTLLERASKHLGYEFRSSISELNNVVYLPSNINTDEFDIFSGFLKSQGVITEGIPAPTDFGYSADQIFLLASNLFNARYQIVQGVIQFHSENSEFWIKNSSYVMQNWLIPGYRYNTDELFASRFLRFTTDISDKYTIENYRGTSYQVLTDPIVINDSRRTGIKGLEEIIFPVALGSRKESLNGFERTLAALAGLFDSVSSIFGGGTNLKSRINQKVGVLKVSDNNHTVPKLLYMQGSRIPSNHRELWSAKVLEDKYHSEKSFVRNGGVRQRIVFEDKRIPFGMNDFQKLISNSYFRTEDGRIGKFISIEWSIEKDYAIVNYWIQETYTRNLRETFIEPD